MLKKLVLKPGINKEGTNYANEDGFFNCDKIRFRSGYAEKIGGWINTNNGLSTYEGIARSILQWASLQGEKITSIGSSQRFYIGYGGAYYNITPTQAVKTLTSNFTVNSGQKNVEININSYGATTGTFFRLTKAYGYLSANITNSAVTIVAKSNTVGTFPTGGGVIQIDNEQIAYTSYNPGTYTFSGLTRGYGNTLNAAHSYNAQIISLESITVGGIEFVYNSTSNTTVNWQIIKQGTTAGLELTNKFLINTATTPSATGTSSGSIYAIFDLNAGEGTSVVINGWGAGGWGLGSWGVGLTATASSGLRLWSQTNYDEDLIFAPRNGNIYWWAKNITTFPIATTLATQASTQVKVSTTADWTAPTTSITVTDSSRINTGALVTGTNIPEGTYVGTTYTFGNTVPLVDIDGNAVTLSISGVGVTVTFSYSGLHVPKTVLLVTTTSQNAFTVAFGATPYNPYDFNTTFDPLLVRWSDQDNPYEWVPEVTNQSGEQRLANGSTIITAANTRQEILIWTDTALYSMQYLGPPYVFGINLLMDNLSIASQNAVITVNNVTYWMGADRFYQYSGRVETLPCTLRQFVYSNLNKAQISQIVCGSNEGFNEVWWFYPSRNSTINDSYVIFNHLDNVWYYGTMNRSAWLDTQLSQYPLGAFSTDRVYLNTPLTDTVTTSVYLSDTTSFPSAGVITIDSEQISYTSNDRVSGILSGGARGVNGTVAATHVSYSRVNFTIPNQLMYHEYQYDDLSTTTPVPIEAYVESSDFDIEDGLNFAYVWRIIPDLTFDGSTASNPQCQLTVKVRQNSGAAYTAHSADTQTVVRTATYPVEQYTGQVYTRVRGRQMGFRMASVDLGVFWQMGLMRIDIKPDGRR